MLALGLVMVGGVSVYADDISVRTSVGSGEVVFTETDEEVTLTEEEVVDLVSNALSVDEGGNLEGFLDVSAKGKISMGEEYDIPISIDVYGSVEKYDEKAHADIHFSYDVMEEAKDGSYELYQWENEGQKLTAVYQDDEWFVTSSDIVEEASEGLGLEGLEEQAKSFKLRGLQKHLYEENDKKYYVCVYTVKELEETLKDYGSESLLDTFGIRELLSDSNLKVVLVIDSVSGLPRAISVDACNAKGSIPESLMEAEEGTSAGYDFSDLYITLLVSEKEEGIEIPEEVLNAPVSSDAISLEDMSEEDLGWSDDYEESSEGWEDWDDEWDDFELEVETE